MEETTDTKRQQMMHDVDRITRMEADDIQTKQSKPLGLLYTIDDTPPWYLCLLLGFQVSAY